MLRDSGAAAERLAHVLSSSQLVADLLQKGPEAVALLEGDLVLRRLTEALARERTRHQVSEVTSLGLVQLTRKRLGTGLVEAFSTSCPQCSGRGIILHADPVDSSAASGRKSDSTGRRGRRSKKSRSDEPVVAKVPAHAPGEHPMFKAMAAANGRHDGEPGEADEELVDASANRASHDESEAEAEEARSKNTF